MPEQWPDSAIEEIEYWKTEVERLRTALRELYAGMMDDSMPGQRLLDWHERHPWADAIVRGL